MLEGDKNELYKIYVDGKNMGTCQEIKEELIMAPIFTLPYSRPPHRRHQTSLQEYNGEPIPEQADRVLLVSKDIYLVYDDVIWHEDHLEVKYRKEISDQVRYIL